MKYVSAAGGSRQNDIDADLGRTKYSDFLRLGVCGAAIAFALLGQGAAFAQSAPVATHDAAADAEDGGIVVTARRRSESLLEVPVTMSVATGEKLQQLNINSLQDLQAYTPGLYTQSNSSGRVDRSLDQVVIRGIADQLLPTVSVFVDGAPVTTDVIQNLGDEIERVEVLKGPQSAAFGRQAFAGAINIVTRDPGNDIKGYVDASVGSYDMHDLRASIELPIITDKMALRLSGRAFSTQGQYENLGSPGTRLGDQKTDTISGTLVIKPVDGLKIKAFASYLGDNDGPGAGVNSSVSPVNTFNCNAKGTGGANNFYCGAIPNYPASQIGSNTVTQQFLTQVINNSLGALNPIFRAFNNHSGLERHEIVANLAIDYDIPGTSIVLSSLTAYDNDKYDINQDLDGRNTAGLAPVTTSLTPGYVSESFLNYPDEVLGYNKDVSQEVRLTSGSSQRFRWMVGANYYKGYARSYVAGMYPGLGVLTYVNGALSTTEDKSAFFSGAFDFTNKLTLNVEGRYLQETLVAYNRTTGQPEVVQDKSTFKKFAPRVSLQFKPTDETMLYATYSKGINRGGFNLTVLSLTPAQRTYLNTQQAVSDIYKPATLDNYEVGLKGALFDHRLTFSLAGFYAKWYDQAFSQSINVPVDVTNPAGSFTVVSVTGNTAQSTVRGAEIEGGLRVTDNFSLTYNGGYSKVTLDHAIQCVACVGITGATTLPKGSINPYSPRFTMSVGGEYTHELTDDYKWFLGADFIHRSKIYTDYENISWIASSDKVNTRIGIRGKRLDAMIFVDNVFNEYAYSGVSLTTSLLGGNAVILSLPVKRTMGARIKFKF